MKVTIELKYEVMVTISRLFSKENVRNPVWICRDPISLNLAT